jgi:hypothetical protein
MQFEVTMRDGTTRHVEASYLEVVHGHMSSSYTLLGPVPGYPTAIVAAFPAELVHAVMPVSQQPLSLRRSREPRVERGPMADERAPAGAVPPAADDLL